MKKPQLFLDLDGVLADFDGHYERQFGIRPDKRKMSPADDDLFWDRVRQSPRFFRQMRPTHDAMDLWNGVKHLDPIILTGVPKSIDGVEEDKREWVDEWIGPNARVICCRSVDKRLHGTPGDVLIDDWDKYLHHWVEMGGIFILHESAQQSLIELGRLL